MLAPSNFWKKLLEKSSRCLFKAWRTVDKPGDLLPWRTDKTFLCSIGSDAFFCNPKQRSWVFVMAAKLSATLSPPTRRNAALLSLQHPCRFKSRSKFSELCSEECRDVGRDSLLTNLEHRKHEWQLAVPCYRELQQCGVLSRDVRRGMHSAKDSAPAACPAGLNVQMVATQTDFPTCDCH